MSGFDLSMPALSDRGFPGVFVEVHDFRDELAAISPTLLEDIRRIASNPKFQRSTVVTPSSPTSVDTRSTVLTAVNGLVIERELPAAAAFYEWGFGKAKDFAKNQPLEQPIRSTDTRSALTFNFIKPGYFMDRHLDRNYVALTVNVESLSYAEGGVTEFGYYDRNSRWHPIVRIPSIAGFGAIFSGNAVIHGVTQLGPNTRPRPSVNMNFDTASRQPAPSNPLHDNWYRD